MVPESGPSMMKTSNSIAWLATLVVAGAACAEIKVQVEQADGIAADGGVDTSGDSVDLSAPDATVQPDTAAGGVATQDGAKTPDAGGDGAPDGGAEVQGDECETAFDCNAKPCELPACDNGFCVKKQKAVGDKCIGPGLQSTECETPSCTADGQCALATKPDGAVCGNFACGKKCEKGKCVGATDLDYEDGNPCTSDSCDQGMQVLHDPITDVTLPCDDGNQCSNGDSCILGQCKGQAIDCGDGFDCTLDTCDPKSGCTHTPDPKGCNDGNPCTVEACDLAVGCTVTGFDGAAACNDSNNCTKDDHCTVGGDCLGKAICACQEDADCKAEDLCLGAPKCVAEKCINDPKVAIKCDSSGDSKCTKSMCDPKTGQCNPAPQLEGQDCNDNDACTAKSTCTKGACIGPVTASCDDNNPCTNDACLPQKGCSYDANTGKCDDGNACSTEDVCDKGGCAGKPTPCADAIVCTLDGCDKKSGKCTNTPDA
ncbi:MAG: hypothetical protein EXR79_06120, partial [Myxococcales bacterium]|nr:hypothetical protein [Myxococcales bacterium]